MNTTLFFQHPTYRHIWVSETGKIYSALQTKSRKVFDSGSPRKLLSCYKDSRDIKAGYPDERIHRYNIIIWEGKRTVAFTHHLVWEAINNTLIPQGKIIRHRDGQAKNNNIINLQLGTYRENNRDTIFHGRGPVGVLNPKVKLTEQDINEIRESAHDGQQTVDLSKKFEMSISQVSNIIKGRAWSHLSNSLPEDDIIKKGSQNIRTPDLIYDGKSFYRHFKYPFLWVTVTGELWSSRGSPKGSPIQQYTCQSIYLDLKNGKSPEQCHKYIAIFFEEKNHSLSCHRLIWEAIHGTIPDKLMICHSDSIASNNRIENLVLATARFNQQDRRRNNLTRKVKISDTVINDIRSEYNLGTISQKQLALKYKLSTSYVYSIINNKLRKTL